MLLRRLLSLALLAVSLSVPAHAATLSAGDVVVADPNSGRILRVDAATDAVSTLLSGYTSHDVTFAPDGRLFASFYYDQRIARVDPVTGSITPVSTGGLLAGIICVEWGPDGYLYAGSNAPRIVRVDPVSGAQSLVCSGGLLGNPQSLAFTPGGDLLVANYNNTVLKVNIANGAQSPYASGGLLGVVSGVTVATDGTVYASDIVSNSLIRIAPITLAQSVVTSGGPIGTPRGIGMDLSGRVLVCSQAYGHLARVTLPSAVAPVTPSYGMSLPYNVAVVPAGVTATRSGSWGAIKRLYR